MKNRKGFTLIELLVVMVIVGILVLLATPKFLNYIRMAKLTQIKHDTKVVENLIVAHMARFNGELPNWAKIPLEDRGLEEYLIDGKVYTTMGKILEDGTVEDNKVSIRNLVYADILEDKNVDIEEDFFIVSEKAKKEQVSSRLKGTFITNKDGKALYIDEDILNEDNILDAEDSIYEFEIFDDINQYEKIKIASVVGFKEEYALKREYLKDENKYHKNGKRTGDISLTGKYRIPDNVRIDGEVYSVNAIGDMDNRVDLSSRNDYKGSESKFYKKEAFAVGTFYGQNISELEMPRSIIYMGLGEFANNKISSFKYYGKKDDEKIKNNFGVLYGEGIFAFNESLKFDSVDEFFDQVMNLIDSNNNPSFFRLEINIPGHTFYRCGVEKFEYKDIGQYKDVIEKGGQLSYEIGPAAFAFNNITGDLVIPGTIREIDDYVFYSNSINKLIIEPRYQFYEMFNINTKSFAFNNIEKVDIMTGENSTDLITRPDSFEGNPISNN